MIPSAQELTAATEAIAAYLWDRARSGTPMAETQWEDLPPMTQLQWRQVAMPPATVALQALPDRGRFSAEQARQEVIAAVKALCCICKPDADHADQCPASSIEAEIAAATTRENDE